MPGGVKTTGPKASETKVSETRPSQDSDKLRVGVIGAGVMGSNHARVFKDLSGISLVGIADPLEAHRQRAINLIGCRTFATIEQMLAEGVDAVTIAAPTHLHHQISLDC